MGRTASVDTTGEALRLLGERLKAQSKRPNIHGYGPHEKQVKFHSSPAKRRLYIGGNRSGKTTGGVVDDIWTAQGVHPYRAVPEPPIRGRVASVDFLNGIQKIILPEFMRWTPVSWLRGGSWSTAYEKLERVLYFENESFIEFMSYDQELDKFAGTSRHFIHCDEEPPEDIYNECRARLVDTGGDLTITMTPIEGMTWIYETLYLPGLEGQNGIEVVEVEMTENPYLNQGEVQGYLDSLTNDERKIRGEGKFVSLGGLIYNQFSKSTHVVDDFVPPIDWLWIASLDHGYNNPTAWLWHAVGPDGQCVTWDEHYKPQMTIDAHARVVHEKNLEHGRPPDMYVGDPSIRNVDPITGTSIHEEYARLGIPIVLGNNDVSAGIVRVARQLKPRPNGTPNLVVCRRCENTIREYGRYRWKTYANRRLINANNAQEVPHKRDDHAMDSTRYFVMSRPELVSETVSVPSPQNILGAPTAHHPTELTVKDLQAMTGDSAWYDGTGRTTWETDEYMGAEF